MLLLRPSEPFAEENGVFHKLYSLRRGDVAFFRRGRQLGKGREQEADKVEVRFKRLKRDKGRKGPVLVRRRNDRARERESGEGGAAELLGELLRMFRGGDARGSAADDVLA